MRRADVVFELGKSGRAGDVMARVLFHVTKNVAVISSEIGPRYLLPSLQYSDIQHKTLALGFWKWLIVWSLDERGL